MWEINYLRRKETGLKKFIASLMHNEFLEWNKVRKMMAERKHLTEPIIPTQKDEAIQSPTDGYVFGIFFDANNDGILDTVLKNFWITDSFNKAHVYDLFFVSEGVTEKVSDDVSVTLMNLRADGLLKFKDVSEPASESNLIAGKTKDHEILFTGSYTGGYELLFRNETLRITGDVTYEPHSKGVLFYNNGRHLDLAGTNIKFYDIFMCDISGKLTISDATYQLRNAKGFLHHFSGTLNMNTIKKWVWINIQLPNGAIQALLMDIKISETEKASINEGAILIDNEFLHILDNEIEFDPMDFRYNKDIGVDIPVE